jgi:AsmA protein
LRHDGGQAPRLGPGRPPPLLRTGEAAPRPRRRRRRWLQFTGYLLLGFACTVVGSITFLLIAAPVDFVRDQMVQQVKAHTGRDLTIAGPTSIALFPQVSVHLADVTLSEPPGMDGGPLLTAKSFAIDVPLLSLLSRQFAVKRLLLVQPTIELRIDADGRRNWSFARTPGGAETAANAGPREPTAAPIPRSPKAAGVAAAFDQLSLENVHISDGTLRFADTRKGALKEITGINVSLSLADPAGPLQGKGNFAWNGEKVAFDGKLSPARALLGEQKGRVALTLTSPLLEAAYDGALMLAPAPALEGKATLKAPSVGALATWLGRHAGTEPAAVDVTAMVSLEQGRLAITDLNGVAGGGTLSGTLALETERARPYLSGTLRTTDLDLGRLLLRPVAPAATAHRAGEAERPGNAEAESAPAGQAPAVASGKRRAAGRGWSEAPIDLALLRLADADVTLVVDRLLYRELQTGQSQLALALKDNVAKLTLQDALLYGGRGRGVLTFDAAGPEPATSTELSLDNVLYRPLLRDALGLEWLTGRGKITLSLSGQGQSERKIIETLKGKAELLIGNGEFAGIDVGKLLRAIEQAHFNRLEVSPEDRTPFSELAGSFQINNGLAETNDLRLVGPHLRLNGSGSTNLVERSADYSVRLKLAETAPSEGAVIKVSGLEFPMHITGPWEKLAFKPDLKGIVNSEQASEAIRQIGKNLNTPEVREAVKGLLNGDGQQRPKARELLEKLLKKQ